MLHTRFTGLVFALFFVWHALKCSSVHAHQGGETTGERHVASEETFVSVQKEYSFGGRKMGGHEVVVRKETGEKQGSEVVASKNSAENNDAEIMSIGKFQGQANNQIAMNKLETKKTDFAGLGNPTSDQPFHLPNSMQLEDSKALPTETSLESHSSRSDKPVTQEPPVIGNRSVESKRLLEAAKEIVSLMNKDYKGSDRPRRRPPINNNVPRH